MKYISILHVAKVMDLTIGSFKNQCWYDDNHINVVLQYAVNTGWVRRPSHTQVEWTEEGVTAYNGAMQFIDDKNPWYLSDLNVGDTFVLKGDNFTLTKKAGVNGYDSGIYPFVYEVSGRGDVTEFKSVTNPEVLPIRFGKIEFN